MHAVVRRYAGASQLADAMTERAQEVQELLTGVPGFRAYYALRSSNGTVVTITVCDDRAGTTESTRRAAEWVGQNLGGGTMDPVQVTDGETFLGF